MPLAKIPFLPLMHIAGNGMSRGEASFVWCIIAAAATGCAGTCLCSTPPMKFLCFALQLIVEWAIAAFLVVADAVGFFQPGAILFVLFSIGGIKSLVSMTKSWPAP